MLYVITVLVASSQVVWLVGAKCFLLSDR